MCITKPLKFMKYFLLVIIDSSYCRAKTRHLYLQLVPSFVGTGQLYGLLYGAYVAVYGAYVAKLLYAYCKGVFTPGMPVAGCGLIPTLRLIGPSYHIL